MPPEVAPSVQVERPVLDATGGRRRWRGALRLGVLAGFLGAVGWSPAVLWGWNGRMWTSASDQELLARHEALQAEASQVLAELDLGQLFADVGPVLVVGSCLSGLMCWRDLDVCLLGWRGVLAVGRAGAAEMGGGAARARRVQLLRRAGGAMPTGEARDERSVLGIKDTCLNRPGVGTRGGSMPELAKDPISISATHRQFA